MNVILSVLFISVGAFAMNMMPPGHSMKEYSCTLTAPMGPGVSDVMAPSPMVMLNHHTGCFGDTMSAMMMGPNGDMMSERMYCQRNWDMTPAHGVFFMCEGNEMFLDFLNGSGTWTMNGMTYSMDCVTPVSME